MIEYEISKKLFNKIYLPYLEDQTYIQIFFGGSASGKSYFLAQRAIIDVVANNRNYLIARKTARTIKKSITNELIKTINNFNMQNLFEINKSDNTFTCINGNQILSAGLDDTEKIKSITPAKGVLTDIWIEEATETDEKDVIQLQKRLRGESEANKRLTMSFNPIYQTHWLYKKYFGSFYGNLQKEKELLIVKTTYLDNDFLTDQDKNNMENEKDEYFRNVYTLGNWGVLGETIFHNFSIEDLSEKKKSFDQIYNGLDFGFSSDPTAFIRLHYDKNNKIIYIIDEFQEKEITNDIIADKLKNIIGSEYITCDSAEPKSIRELQLLGVRALSAKKGKNSINFGIDWLKRHKIIIDQSCINTKRELELYRYKQDKNGIAINVPIDRDNHCIDALRYALENIMVEEEAIIF